MKTFAAFVVVLLIAGSAHGAAITYEHVFAVEGEHLYSRDELWDSGPQYGLPDPYDFWTIPAFDFSSGIPEVLLLEIEGTLTISGRIHDLDGNPEVHLWATAATLSLHDQSWMGGIGGASATCTAAPCDFLGDGPLTNYGYVLPNADKTSWEVPYWLTSDVPGITMPIALYSADTIFTLRTPTGEFESELAFTPITIRTELTGIARATYIYEPAAIPEPATLLLLGSGVAVLVRHRTSKRRRS